MGGGLGGWPTPPPLVSDSSEVRRAEKCFWDPPLLFPNQVWFEGPKNVFETPPPPPTIVRLPFLKVWICHCCVRKRNSFYLTMNLNVLSNGNSIWDFYLDVLFICTCSPQNLLPVRIVLLLGVEGHYHYWDGIFPCLPAKLRMAKYTYQLCVALRH